MDKSYLKEDGDRAASVQQAFVNVDEKGWVRADELDARVNNYGENNMRWLTIHYGKPTTSFKLAAAIIINFSFIKKIAEA